MATLLYKGLSGIRVTITVNTTDDLTTITNAIIANEGLDPAYYADFVLDRNNSIRLTNNALDTYADLGLTSADMLVAILDDDPATYTKEQRQVQKLEIAVVKRTADSRPNTYDINKLPNPYNGNSADPDDGSAGPLIQGRPWS